VTGGGSHSGDRSRSRGRPDPTGGDSGAERAGGLTLAEAQAAVDAWISRFDEGYWPPLANLARLVEEVGELAREINHHYGSKPKKPEEPEADLALEMADILFVLIALANEQRIDLEAAFERVLEKYRVRDAGRWTEK
jgi:NTP pyrophosphatase (non-canonical NTP hydrolase)